MAYWYRRVFLLAFPLILSNLTQPLLSTVDTILSGHLPGAAALGGVAIGGIFFNSVFWTFAFLRMSTGGLVAQAHGARDLHQLQLHFVRAMLAAAAIGAVLLAIKAPLISITVRLLGAEGAVAQNAVLYCGIRIWSAPAALANYVILGTLLGRQRPRAALLIQAFINAVNVAVALALVLGLHWGVAGIAIGTMTADFAGLLLGALTLAYLKVLSGEARLFRLRRGDILHGPSLWHLFGLNRDLMLRNVGLVCAYAWFTRSGARESDTLLAANALLLNLHNIAAYGLDGFANATEALVGEAIGARRFADYRAVLAASTGSAGIVALLTSLVYLLSGQALIHVFTNLEAVRAAALHYLPWAIVMPVIAVWAYQLDGIFVGATRGRDLRNSMLLSFAGFMVLAVLLEQSLGNAGLWCALAGFMVLRSVTLALRLPGIRAVFHTAPTLQTSA